MGSASNDARVVAGICVLTLFLPATATFAQQTIGTVGVQDATVSGALEVSNGRAVLVSNTTIKARDHATDITLSRGGEVLVCATSGLHLTAGKTAADPAPLMFALDRGAMEIRMAALQNDIIMTPDLRFSMRSAGVLDLRVRVTPNGDTCVENRGDKAPALNIADQFGQSTYELKPDQHVLFEHGSLKEVVDHESSPCGCPTEPAVSVADSGVRSSTPAGPGAAISPGAAEEQYPFPAAVSAGLAPPSSVPQAQPGTVHAQVSTAMTYNAGEDTPPDAPSSPSAGAASAPPSQPTSKSQSAPALQTADTNPTTTTAPPAEKAQAPLPPPASSGGNVFRSIGHFFKRLFGGGG